MEYNRLIDHTLLKPDCHESQIVELCKEAKEYKFASVCVNPCFVPLCHDLLKESQTKVCTVISFPLGQSSTKAKVEETKKAIEDGAEEIDMVINVSKLKDHQDEYVYEEIRQLKECCGDLILKVIIETCLLTDEEKVRACELAKKAKADFVKTSTGFSTGGATAHDVKLMRETVGPNMGVKASGGIRTKEDMLTMIQAGANRIGTSNGVKLIK